MTLGITGSATYSQTLNGIGEIMNVLPDNTGNLVTARNLRDVSLTLYEQIVGLSSSQGSGTVSGSASGIYYTNLNPSVTSVGGLNSGSTFNNISIQDLLDNMLYPYVMPTFSLSSNPSILEYGNTQTVTLNWYLTIKKNSVISATIFRTTQAPYSTPTNTNSGSVTATPTINVTNTFTYSVNDYNSSNSTGGTNTATTQVTWQNKRFWGTFSTFTLPNNAQILALNSELSNTRVQNRSGINGGGNYLVFAWPTSFGTPTFTVNGLNVNTFTKLGSSISFTNAYGYSATPYDVWFSNTQQNSAIASFLIS